VQLAQVRIAQFGTWLRRRVAQSIGMSRGRTTSATSCGVMPRLKPMIQSASSRSFARTRYPLISRKVSIATSAWACCRRRTAGSRRSHARAPLLEAQGPLFVVRVACRSSESPFEPVTAAEFVRGLVSVCLDDGRMDLGRVLEGQVEELARLAGRGRHAAGVGSSSGLWFARMSSPPGARSRRDRRSAEPALERGRSEGSGARRPRAPRPEPMTRACSHSPRIHGGLIRRCCSRLGGP
jgi:hypothetical protein